MTMKHRVIPVLLKRGAELVKGTQFNSWRSCGHAAQAVRIYDARNVDELVVLDVSATSEKRLIDIEAYAGDCFMPLSVGGGVRTCEDIRLLLAKGADKVVIGTAAFENSFLITEASRQFGAQAIVVSVDVDEHNEVKVRSGQFSTHQDVERYARRMQDLGAGELIVNSICRDGTLLGYDLQLIARVASAVTIPCVALGGAGEYQHMADALAVGAHAVGAGAMFQYTDATPREAARFLAEQGFNMRVAA